MRVPGIALALVLSAGPAFASPGPTDAEILAFAEESFSQGVNLRDDSRKARSAFAQSATGYDELWQRGHRNPKLALNRAHSHRLAGNLPAAIVALNEGIAVSPWNRSLQLALEDARNAVAYPLTGDLVTQCRPPATVGISTRMSPIEAWVIAGLMWLLACGGVARFAMTRRPAWLLWGVVCVVGLAVLGSAWWQDSRERQHAKEATSVVLAHDVVLRKGNASTYPARLDAKLPRGVEARKLVERGGWIQLQLAGGIVGWVPASAVLGLRELEEPQL